MGTSITLFRIFGIELKVHWSFVLILAWGAFIYSSGPAGPVIGALYGVVVILFLFVCVVLHELGHAVTAKYFKVNVPTITLLPIGGVAQLERMPDKPLQEFLIAVAGPLVNFVLALLLLPVAAVLIGLGMNDGTIGGGFMDWIAHMQIPSFSGLVIYLTVTNVVLGVFNLLPAFPMDGGRILRALLALGFPYVQATRVAVYVGRFMAILFAIWGIMGGGIFMLLIAFFVYVGGGSELEAVESRAVLKRVAASSALNADALDLFASEQLGRAVELIMSTYQADFPVLDLSGRFVGVLTRSRLVAALREVGEEGRVVDAMIPAAQIPTCAPTTSLADVWEKIMQSRIPVVAVMDRGRFEGLLTLADLTEVFEVMGAQFERQAVTQPPVQLQGSIKSLGGPITPTPAERESTKPDSPREQHSDD